MAISKRTRFIVFQKDNYRCQLCGKTAQNGARLEVDNRLPVAKGGTNELPNLWTLCFSCNRGKHDLYLDIESQSNPSNPVKIAPVNSYKSQPNSLYCWRVSKGFTVGALAEKSGLSYLTIQNLQTGKAQTAKLSTVKKLSDALGVEATQVTEFAKIIEGK